jgi:hypothetical protein
MRFHRTTNSLGRHPGSLSGSSAVFLGIISALMGEDSGADLCGCSPGSFEFTFDFSLTCPPVNITSNGGVAATFCQISPFGEDEDNITDLVPVSTSLGVLVSSIIVASIILTQ